MWINSSPCFLFPIDFSHLKQLLVRIDLNNTSLMN
jgi:hypothetical protein